MTELLTSEITQEPTGEAVVPITASPASPLPFPIEVKRRTKIAIIGKAPSSRLLAPYDRPDEWEIWSLSDNYNVIPRWDRWFELHDLDRYKELYPEYYDWMAALDPSDRPLYVSEARDDIPAGRGFQWECLVKEYGYYFTNSISWMHALAIEVLKDIVLERRGKINASDGKMLKTEARSPDVYDLNWRKELKAIDATIGLWGVDMAQHEEYRDQRPSCEYHIGVGEGLGITTIVPDECDMMKCARLYGVEANRGNLDIKIRARQKELQQRIAKHEMGFREAEQASTAAMGAYNELTAISKLNGELTPDWLKQRMEQVAKDGQNAKMTADRQRDMMARLSGAVENLQWCRQWA